MTTTDLIYSTVMLVEDDDATRISVAVLLRQLGYRVREFSHGGRAWESFNEEPSRIVIADWKLPGMDGVDLCQRIRNRRMTEYTYFILTTAADPGEIGYDYAIGSDVDDLVVKPFEFSALWRRMRVAERIFGLSTARQPLEPHLSICSCCHQIRDPETETWAPLEEFLMDRTGSNFSHGFCVECEQRMRRREAGGAFSPLAARHSL